MIYRKMFDFPNWRTSHPFAELESLRRQMDLLAEGLAGRPVPAKTGVFPLINLSENTDHYFVRAELPGINADDMNIEAEGNKISISGERKMLNEDENAKGDGIDDSKDTFERTGEHLADNGVDIDKTRLTLGPWLRFDPDKEQFVGNAPADAMLTREYRRPFVVPTEDEV